MAIGGPGQDPRRLPQPRQAYGVPESRPGRERVARRLAADRQPYGYESNRRLLAWLSAALSAWVVLALFTAWHDNRTGNMLERWRNLGFSTVPKGQSSLDDLVVFAAYNGVACNSVADIASRTAECDRVLDFAAEVNSAESTSSIVFVGQLLAFLAALYLLGSFIYHANRNLRPLKAEGQVFSPGWAVGWLFVPFLNLWQPLQVLGELWRGSDPDIPVGDTTGWQQTRRSPLVSFWWLTVVAAALLSPPVLTRVLASTDIEARIAAASFMVWTDVLMVLPAIVGIVFLRALHNRQEARFRAVGPVQALPVTAGDIAEARRQQRRKGDRRR